MIQQNTDIRDLTNIAEIVDCVTSGVYGDSPLKLIQAFDSMPHNHFGDYQRVLSVPYLFHRAEAIFKSKEEPVGQFIDSLCELERYANEAAQNKRLGEIYANVFEQNNEDSFDEEVKSHTGKHYGNLFKEFDQFSYFEESKNLLKTRLERNGIFPQNLDKLEVLDQGCGGGRYTVSWKLLGAKKATGIDFSSIGIEDAVHRVQNANIQNVSFIHGSVLDMPFKNESFDIVYSNGVLHHTDDWKKGIEELLRVLKKGGSGWLYLIENPGGIFWDKIEILRAILRRVNKKFAQEILKSFGIPMNRVFYMLDHVMVPINTRLTVKEITDALVDYGASDIIRLERGCDFDRSEAIFQKKPFATEKFGVGEQRFWFSKK